LEKLPVKSVRKFFKPTKVLGPTPDQLKKLSMRLSISGYIMNIEYRIRAGKMKTRRYLSLICIFVSPQ
jgi:hypothetical protein